jgi:acetyltransferase-like isoleucine patch superfamily enzyme
MFKKLGKSVMIDYQTYFRYPRKISIGSNVSINRGTKIFASYHYKEAEIIIGNDISIGPEVVIFSAGHDHQFINLPDIAKTIKINDCVWIGGRSVILPGVEIGEGAVIGAGSIVTKNIPPYTIAAGNPAKAIKPRTIKSQQSN